MKRFKIGASVLFFVACATVTFTMNLTTDEQDEYRIQANTEALAQGEGGGEWSCYGSGSIVCGKSTYRARYE